MDLNALLTGMQTFSSGNLSAVDLSSATSSFGGMFSGPYLIASFLISTIGFSYFMYGKKNGYVVALISGLLLMVFPYFVHDMVWMICIALGLCILPFFLRR